MFDLRFAIAPQKYRNGNLRLPLLGRRPCKGVDCLTSSMLDTTPLTRCSVCDLRLCDEETLMPSSLLDYVSSSDSCPGLQNSVLSISTKSSSVDVNISSPTLQKFKIGSPPGLKDVFNRIGNPDSCSNSFNVR